MRNRNLRSTVVLVTLVVVTGLLIAPAAGVVGSANAQVASVYDGTVIVEETGEPIGEEVTISAYTDDGGNTYTEEESVLVSPDGSFTLDIPEPADNQTIQFRITVNGEDVTVETAEWEDGSFEITVTPTLNELDRNGPSFDITIDEQASTTDVTAGDDLQIVSAVENTGDVQATQDIELTDDSGTVLANETVTRAPGESGSVSLNYTTAQDDTPIETVTVNSDDASDTTSVNIDGPPLFDVSITDAPDTVTATQPISVTAAIENTGDADATQDLNFTVAGTQEDTATDVTLSAGESTTETFTYDSVQGDADRSPLTVAVASDDTTDSRNVTVEAVSGSLTFRDQATNSTQLNSSDPTTPGVVVESVRANLDSTVIVTYEDDGDTVIAGIEQFSAAEINGTNRAISIADAGGFPGEHTAHVVPNTGLSSTYTAGDTVSSGTLDAVLANETATVFEGSVTLDDQNFVSNTTEVNVTASDLAPSTEYVVVVHPLVDGEIQDPIGASDPLTGAATETTVPVDEINTTGEFVAMLHFENNGERGVAIRNADADDGFVPGNVVDAGTVTIREPATATLSNLAVNGAGENGTIVAGENATVAVDVENTGDLDGEFDVTLDINGTSETQPVNLTSGEATTTTFEPATNELAADTYTVSVTADNTVTGTLEVREPTTPALSELDIADNGTTGDIVEGDDTDVAVNVTNDGEVENPVSVSLDIEGQDTVSQTTDPLAGGATEPVTFANVTSALAPDTDPYNVTVSATSGDRTATTSGTLLVRTAAVTSLDTLDIAGQGTDATITEGDDEAVSVNVTNEGDVAGSATVELRLGDRTRTEQVTDLGGGATESVTFDNVTGDLADDTYTVTVATANNSAAGTLTVRQPATAEFSALDIAGQGTDAVVFTDENESISVDLENTGDVNGTFDVAINVTSDGGGVIFTQRVTANASEPVQTIETDPLPDDLAAGDYTVTVESTNTLGNNLSGDLRVRTPVDDGTAELEGLTIADQGSNAEIVAGTDGVVAVDVTNTGTTDGSVSVDLTIDGETTRNASTVVDVASGATQTATFDTVIGDLEADDYTVTVASDAAEDTVTGTLTVLTPAASELSELDIAGQGTDATITEGDDETVTVNVTNTRGDTREFDVNLTVDGEPAATETVSVDAGGTVPVSFDGVTGELVADGDETVYDIAVSTADDTAPGTLAVRDPEAPDPAAANLTTLDIATQGDSARLTPGDERDVAVTIENTGDLEGTFETTLTIDNGTEVVSDSTPVTLDGSMTDTVTFENVTGDLAADEYTVTVTADGSQLTGSLAVRPAPDAIGGTDENTTAQDLDDDGTFEDVNGDGEEDLRDVFQLFNNQDAVPDDDQEAFDYNGDGEFTIVDIDRLFRQEGDN